MYKSVRMGCSEAYSKCKSNLVVYTEAVDYESIVNGMRSAYSENANDEELDFALFIKSDDLSEFYASSEWNDYFDPATQHEIMKYGYLGTLAITLNNGSEWPCHVYTDASPDKRDRFLNFTVLKMQTTEIPDVTEAVAALKRGDESVLQKMVDERIKQL